MKPIKLTLIALMALILALSGCVKTQNQCPVVISQTDGLVVDRFQPSYDMIPVGSTVSVQMDLSNKGASKAEDITTTLWSYGGFTIVPASDKKQLIDPLYPGDLSICSAGDATTVTWTLEAGCDPREVVLSAFVDYKYTSEGYAEILLASQAEAERVRGEFMGGEKSANVPGAGPIQVKIEPLQTEPVVISNNTPNFDIRIMLKNTGKGLAGSMGNGSIDSVELTVEGPCEFLDEEGDSTNDTYLITGTQLPEGSQEALEIAHLNCTDTNFIKDKCTVHVKATYQYRIVAATQKKMGISGSKDQVDLCRKNLAP